MSRTPTDSAPTSGPPCGIHSRLSCRRSTPRSGRHDAEHITRNRGDIRRTAPKDQPLGSSRALVAGVLERPQPEARSIRPGREGRNGVSSPPRWRTLDQAGEASRSPRSLDTAGWAGA
nr:MAG TPA: hypothetical protein [Caudoviricetes sp.]